LFLIFLNNLKTVIENLELKLRLSYLDLNLVCFYYIGFALAVTAPVASVVAYNVCSLFEKALKNKWCRYWSDHHVVCQVFVI